MLLSAFRRVIWSLLLLAAVATPARAQDMFAVPYAGVKFGGDTSIVDLEVSTGRRMFSMGGSIVVLGPFAPATGCVKSTASATATTFVSPASVTHAMWTWYAAYYSAP